MSSPIGQALLERIKGAPADDGPRIVYADWLMAQGAPRGELIALQCKVAAAPPRRAAASGVRVRRSNEAEIDEASKRVTQLLAQNKTTWTWGADADFRRGFIEGRVLASADWFMQHATALLDAEPFATTFHLSNVHGRVRELTGSAALAQITGLRLVAIAPDDIAPLREASLPQLTSLELGAGDGDFRGALTRLFEASWIPQLSRLALSGGVVDLAAVEAIAAARLQRLESLDVASNGMTAEMVERLCATELVQQLHGLALGGNQGVAGAMSGLLARPLPQLRRLDLSGSDAIHAAANLIEARDRLPGLEMLDLRRPLEGDRIPRDRARLITRLREVYKERVLLD